VTPAARALIAVLVDTESTLAHWWASRTEEERDLVEARCVAALEQASRG